MSRPKTMRPPPATRAVVAPQPPPVTAADLDALARTAGLRLCEAADTATLAGEVTEALRDYTLFHRADHAEAGAGEVERWARDLERWADNGLALLGGPFDGDAQTSGWSPHVMAAQWLVDGWPAHDVPPRLTYLKQVAAGHPGFPPEELPYSPGLVEVVRRCAAAAELIRTLAGSRAERATSQTRETKRTEHARRDLVKRLGEAYQRLHGRKPTFSNSFVHVEKGSKRENVPTGASLAWFRGLLDMLAGRCADPVMVALAAWARRLDTIPSLLREINRQSPR